MKKKMSVGLATVLIISLLVMASASAAIPSSKTITFDANGYIVLEYARITATSGTSTTSYGHTTDILSFCEIGWNHDGDPYAKSSYRQVYGTNATKTLYVDKYDDDLPSPMIRCFTGHIIPSVGVDEWINYGYGPSGEWWVD